ncbi:MAG: FAD-binding oxidoreductase [Cryomorphaceae bacterium]
MKIIIIGSGLAGIALAEQLRRADCEVKILSQTLQKSSTSLATGMYNPVVFRRLNLSWMVEDLLPHAVDFYRLLEKKLGVTLFQPIKLAKRIPSKDYALLWEKRRANEPHSSYMAPIQSGFGEVKQAGMIDCALLKRAYEAHVEVEGDLINRALDYTELRFEANQVLIGDAPYDLLIFCEGPYGAENPYFNWLPFNVCRGEWVIIETSAPLTDRVLNNKTNVIPMGGNRYKLSSTYNWDELDWNPHEQDKESLLNDFKELFDGPFTLIEHRAGLRPTVADRRPYLGRHPVHKSLAIFNGLGSKGVMLAPYFAKQLADHLLHDTPLLPEVDIQRHIKRFQNHIRG